MRRATADGLRLAAFSECALVSINECADGNDSVEVRASRFVAVVLKIRWHGPFPRPLPPLDVPTDGMARLTQASLGFESEVGIGWADGACPLIPCVAAY
jgi:hypothetical protein